MKKGRKFMLVIALLLTVLPLVGCGEKAKENEIKKYKEDNYTEVSDDVQNDSIISKTYITTSANIVNVTVDESEAGYKLILKSYKLSGKEGEYSFDDIDLDNPMWTYETKTIDCDYYNEGIDAFQNPENMDIIFLVERNKVSALDTNTGELIWSNSEAKNDVHSYLVADGKLYTMNIYNTQDINVLDTKTGKYLKTLNFKQIESFDIKINNLIGDELNITDYATEKSYSININTNTIKENKIYLPIDETYDVDDNKC